MPEFVLPFLVLAQTIALPIRLGMATVTMQEIDDWVAVAFLCCVLMEYADVAINLERSPYVRVRLTAVAFAKPLRFTLDVLSILPWHYILPVVYKSLSAPHDPSALPDGAETGCVSLLEHGQVRWLALMRLPRLLPIGRLITFLDAWYEREAAHCLPSSGPPLLCADRPLCCATAAAVLSAGRLAI
jgi:hypothetical protein